MKTVYSVVCGLFRMTRTRFLERDVDDFCQNSQRLISQNLDKLNQNYLFGKISLDI